MGFWINYTAKQQVSEPIKKDLEGKKTGSKQTSLKYEKSVTK